MASASATSSVASGQETSSARGSALPVRTWKCCLLPVSEGSLSICCEEGHISCVDNAVAEGWKDVDEAIEAVMKGRQRVLVEASRQYPPSSVGNYTGHHAIIEHLRFHTHNYHLMERCAAFLGDEIRLIRWARTECYEDEPHSLMESERRIIFDCALGGRLDPVDMIDVLYPGLSRKRKEKVLKCTSYLNGSFRPNDIPIKDLMRAYEYNRLDLVDEILEKMDSGSLPKACLILLTCEDYPHFLKLWKRADERNKEDYMTRLLRWERLHVLAYKSRPLLSSRAAFGRSRSEEVWRAVESYIGRDHSAMFDSGCDIGDIRLIKKALKGTKMRMDEDDFESALLGCVASASMECLDFVLSLDDAPPMTENLIGLLVSKALSSRETGKSLIHLKEIGGHLLNPNDDHTHVCHLTPESISAFLRVFPPEIASSPKFNFTSALRDAAREGNIEMIEWLLARGVPSTREAKTALIEYNDKWRR